jgi:hypothetical protein
MALTSDIIKANKVLSGLSEEQLKAIVELSTNDESTVIGNRIGEIYGQLDKDIFAVTGVEKKQGVRTYEYMKEILGRYKEEAASVPTLQGDIAKLKDEITGYKKTIAEGKGNEEIAQQLRDAQKQLSDSRELLTKTATEWDAKYKALDQQYKTSIVDGEFAAALSGIKLKSIYPEAVQRTLIDSAKRSVLAQSTPEIQETDGKRTLVFRGADGNIRTNPENKLNPYTAAELLRAELRDVIEPERRQAGGGTQPPQPQPAAVDVTGARSQVEADDIIAKDLLAKGFVRGSQEFAAESLRLRREYGVEKLPIQ